MELLLKLGSINTEKPWQTANLLCETKKKRTMASAPLTTNNHLMPCPACKLLRRRCTADCIFLPYFPPTEPANFVVVHRIFGATNIRKMLMEISTSDRADAAASMIYEAKARLADPVYSCVGLIAALQTQVLELQSQLNAAVTEIMTLKTQLSNPRTILPSMSDSSSIVEPCHSNHQQFDEHNSQPNFVTQCYSSLVMDSVHIDEFCFR